MITEQQKLVLALKGFVIESFELDDIYQFKYRSSLKGPVKHNSLLYKLGDRMCIYHSAMSNKSLKQAELNLLKKLKKEGIL
jgi:hypothetical protein